MRSDEELMLSYVKGDQAAFRELFQRYAPILLRMLLRNVGRAADAQDLTQQTFLQLHRARHDFRRDTRLRPWIMTIALNLARDLLRRRGRRPELEIDEEVLAAPAAASPAANVDDRARVRRALAELPTEQREVIELHWFEELPFNDIAAMLGCSPGAVRVRAHRGYVNLRKTLGNVVPSDQDDEPAAGDR
ncbi:MAG TPA: RNA polymerase sigma factor [Haliangiales bacterium]|nr:RNA polymerase sigma factor [Haliangiales bacterium]